MENQRLMGDKRMEIGGSGKGRGIRGQRGDLRGCLCTCLGDYRIISILAWGRGFLTCLGSWGGPLSLLGGCYGGGLSGGGFTQL